MASCSTGANEVVDSLFPGITQDAGISDILRVSPEEVACSTSLDNYMMLEEPIYGEQPHTRRFIAAPPARVPPVTAPAPRIITDDLPSTDTTRSSSPRLSDPYVLSSMQLDEEDLFAGGGFAPCSRRQSAPSSSSTTLSPNSVVSSDSSLSPQSPLSCPSPQPPQQQQQQQQQQSHRQDGDGCPPAGIGATSQHHGLALSPNSTTIEGHTYFPADTAYPNQQQQQPANTSAFQHHPFQMPPQPHYQDQPAGISGLDAEDDYAVLHRRLQALQEQQLREQQRLQQLHIQQAHQLQLEQLRQQQLIHIQMKRTLRKQQDEHQRRRASLASPMSVGGPVLEAKPEPAPLIRRASVDVVTANPSQCFASSPHPFTPNPTHNQQPYASQQQELQQPYHLPYLPPQPYHHNYNHHHHNPQHPHDQQQQQQSNNQQQQQQEQQQHHQSRTRTRAASRRSSLSSSSSSSSSCLSPSSGPTATIAKRRSSVTATTTRRASATAKQIKFIHTPCDRAPASRKQLPKPHVQQCIECGTKTTCEWRRGWDNKKSLCNPCGLRYGKHVRARRASQSC